MASWTNPTTKAVGDVLSAANWNAVANNTTFLYQAPYGLYYNSVAMPNQTSLTFQQVTLGGTTGSAYGFSVSSNNVNVPLAGIYAVSANVTVNGASTNAYIQQTAIYHNGGAVAYFRSEQLQGFYDVSTAGSAVVSCAASTDTIALYYAYNGTTAANPDNSATNTFIHTYFVGSL
jgi:methyl coenzyme M reductase beta subunit